MRVAVLPLLAILIITSGLYGCTSVTPARPDISTRQISPSWKSVRLPDDVKTLELKSGQIIVTDPGSPTAVFFSLFAENFSPFIHAGIVVIENGEPFVYESYGQFRPWFGGRPTDMIRGKVMRSLFAKFVERGKYVEVYDLPANTDAEQVALFVQSQYVNQTAFDPYFRYSEHEALYCTELAALAMKAGGFQIPALTPFPHNPSLTRVRHWLRIDDRGTIQSQQLIEPDRFAAAISIIKEQDRFQIYIEIKRELHRRYTSNQKLGNLFKWNGKRLEFRQTVKDFIVAGMEIYRGKAVPPITGVRKEIRALAVQMFGQISG